MTIPIRVLRAATMALVLGLPGWAAAQADPAAQERLRMLELLRTARPAPNPVGRAFTDEETMSPEQRATVEYDLTTGRVTRYPASPLGESGILLPADEPFPGLLPAVASGDEGRLGKTLDIEATPPTAHSDNTYFPWNTMYKMLMRYDVGGADYYYGYEKRTAKGE